MYTYLIYLFFWTFFFNVRLIQCVEADRWKHMNWWYHQLSSEKFLAGFTFGFTLASKLLISNNSHPMVITFSILSTWLNSHCQTFFFLSLSLLLSSLYMCPIDTLCSCQTRQTSGNETHRNAQSSYFLHQTTLFWCFPQQDGHGRFRANLAADGYSSPDNPVVDFLSWNWNIGRNVVHPWNSTGNLKKEVCRKRRCVFFLRPSFSGSMLNLEESLPVMFSEAKLQWNRSIGWLLQPGHWQGVQTMHVSSAEVDQLFKTEGM